MFNWFKSKVELKNEKWIMSSIDNKNGLKMGSEIVVPDNFQCLIYHKGKCFSSLTGGKYKLEKSTFEHLIKVQQKNKSKIKRVKFVSHFISLSNQQLEFKYKGTKYLVNFIINNTASFANLMLLYSYKVDNSYVINYLAEIFEELLIYCNKEHNKITADALKEYGISIISFSASNDKVSIFSLNSTAKIANTDLNIVKSKQSSTPPTHQHNDTNQESINYPAPTSTSTKTQVETTTQLKSVDLPKCPKCGNITRFVTTYCLKCGHKFD